MKISKNIQQTYEGYSDEVLANMQQIHNFLKNKFGEVSEAWTISLQMLAENISIFYQCKESIKNEGMLITDRFGCLVKNPLLKVENDAAIQIQKILTQFGLTLYSLNKLKTNEEEDTEDFIDQLVN